MKRTLVAGLLAFSFLPSAYANNFNYNYFEVRTAVSPETTGLELSTYLTDNSHLLARVDSGFNGYYDLAAGIGFNGPVTDFADVFGQFIFHGIRYSDEEDNKDDETKKEMNIGVRLWLTNQIEAEVLAGTNDDNSVFRAGARFHSTDQLTIAAQARNDGTLGPQIVMSVRFQF